MNAKHRFRAIRPGEPGIAQNAEVEHTRRKNKDNERRPRLQKEKLPMRREGGFTQKVKIDGISVYLRTGEYEDGRLGEIFIDVGHTGSNLKAMINCFCISVSIALQHRVPLEDYVDKFLFTKFEPAGIVTGHEHIATAQSIIDFTFRELAIHYLDRKDLIQKEPPIVAD